MHFIVFYKSALAEHFWVTDSDFLNFLDEVFQIYI